MSGNGNGLKHHGENGIIFKHVLSVVAVSCPKRRSIRAVSGPVTSLLSAAATSLNAALVSKVWLLSLGRTGCWKCLRKQVAGKAGHYQTPIVETRVDWRRSLRQIS